MILAGQKSGVVYALDPDNQGEILWQSGTDAEIGTVKIDHTRSEKVRRIWPYLRDRRIDAYADLTRRYLD